MSGMQIDGPLRERHLVLHLCPPHLTGDPHPEPNRLGTACFPEG